MPKQTAYSKEQLEAINHEYGNLQIIACAGSGKTEVISNKVAKLISNGHKSESIVAFTFTDKAAESLKLRIRQAVEKENPENSEIGNMYIGTIHGYCFELLKEFQPQYANFDPLDEKTRITFLANFGVYKNLKLDVLDQIIPGGKYATIEKFCDSVDTLREEDTSSEKLSEGPFKESMRRYEKLIIEKKVIDFTSMLYLAVKMLENNPDILQKVREKYRFVIVDEYQDVNKIQEKLIKLLCSDNGNLTVVGDDDQAIYQWRGTNVENILTFNKRYENVKQVKLEENFRSSQSIIANANSVIANNTNRLSKKMIKKNKDIFYERGDCYSLEFASADEEAEWIVNKIAELRGTEFSDGGIKRKLALSDFVILVRSVKDPANFLIPKLRQVSIDYVVKGKSGLFIRPEIQLVISCFSYVSGFAYGTSSVSTPDALKKLYETTFPNKISRSKNFAKKMEEVKNRVWKPTTDEPSVLQQMYHAILDAIGLGEEEFSEIEMFQFGKFSTVISDFESFNITRKIEGLKWFFGYIRGFANRSYSRGGEDEDIYEEAVTISSVHNAKGLEYPVVFIPYLLDDFFPSYFMGNSKKWLFSSSLLENPDRYSSNEEDERRLFYVAITRSKKFLFLSYSKITHRQKQSIRSRFFYELDSTMFLNKSIRDPTKRKKGDGEYVTPLKAFPTSYSELRYYLACPYDYKMRYIYQFNPFLKTALGYGKQLHNSLNQIHKTYVETGRMSEDLAKEIVEKDFFLRYVTIKKLFENFKKGATNTILNYVSRYSSEFDMILESEKPFEFALGNILISGTIDLIKKSDIERPEIIEIIDFKTETQRKDGEVPFDTQNQLMLYAIASKESLGYNPKKALVHNLDSNSRHEVEIGDKKLDEAKERIKNIVEKIRERDFPMHPDNGRVCDDCDWKMICTKKIGKNRGLLL